MLPKMLPKSLKKSHQIFIVKNVIIKQTEIAIYKNILRAKNTMLPILKKTRIEVWNVW